MGENPLATSGCILILAKKKRCDYIDVRGLWNHACQIEPFLHGGPVLKGGSF